MFTSDTKERAQKNSSARPSFKEDAHVPVVKRARAHPLCQGTPREDAAGGLEGDLHNHQFSYRCERRLPITKKGIERKDRGVVACQPVPLAHLHGIARFC